jgi:RimJ/RimL family protein N-acetyltransferase
MPAHPDPWPFRHLVLRTPRLELRPDDDSGLRELVAVAYDGVHPPAEMPFGVPWTDADPADLGRNSLQYFWGVRAELSPSSWELNFLARLDGAVVGTQGLKADGFAITREVHTGSWLGIRHQGRGLGTEMRAAVLALAFDHLGAETARSTVFTDNPASLRVSAKLGYRHDGTTTDVRRGRRAGQHRMLLTRSAYTAHRPDWSLWVDGLEDCRALLGAQGG